jgi:hypothetical protein
MINEEELLQEYLISHPPYPFQLLVERPRGNDNDIVTASRSHHHQQQRSRSRSWRGCSMVFCEPGTLHYLVIETKYLRPCPSSTSTMLSSVSVSVSEKEVLEYALRNGMEFRKRIRRQQHQKQQQQHQHCLIIAAMFTNEFGLKLVGHVEESSFEDVQFRIMMSSSSSSLVSYQQPSTILPPIPLRDILQFMPLQELSIYRWVGDNESWNLIGFHTSSSSSSKDPDSDLESDFVNIKNNLSIPTYYSLTEIVKRNNHGYSSRNASAVLSNNNSNNSILRKALTKIMLEERSTVEYQCNDENKILPQQRKSAPMPTSKILISQSGVVKPNHDMIGSFYSSFVTTQNNNNLRLLSSSSSTSTSTIAKFLSDAFLDNIMAFHQVNNAMNSTSLQLCSASNNDTYFSATASIEGTILTKQNNYSSTTAVIGTNPSPLSTAIVPWSLFPQVKPNGIKSSLKLAKSRKASNTLSPGAKSWTPQLPLRVSTPWSVSFLQQALLPWNQIKDPWSLSACLLQKALLPRNQIINRSSDSNRSSSQEISNLPKEQAVMWSPPRGRMLWAPQQSTLPPKQSTLSSLYPNIPSSPKERAISLGRFKTSLSAAISSLSFPREKFQQDEYPPVASSSQGLSLELVLLPNFFKQHNPMLVVDAVQRVLKSPKQRNLSIATSSPRGILKNRNKQSFAITMSSSPNGSNQNKSPTTCTASAIGIEKEKKTSLGNNNSDSIVDGNCTTNRQLFTIKESYSDDSSSTIGNCISCQDVQEKELLASPKKREEDPSKLLAAKQMTKRAPERATSFATATADVAGYDPSDQKTLDGDDDCSIFDDRYNVLYHLFKDNKSDDDDDRIVDKYNVLKQLFDAIDNEEESKCDVDKPIGKKVCVGCCRKTFRRIYKEVTVQPSSFIAGIVTGTETKDTHAAASSDGPTSDRAVRTTTATATGDVAINLLCTYQQSLLPGLTTKFQIRHESTEQRLFRERIESSSYCQHLMNGRFIVDFVQPNNKLDEIFQLRIWKDHLILADEKTLNFSMW